jgi:hypothetical protein
MVTLHEATSDLIMPTVLQTADRGTTHKLPFEMLTALFAMDSQALSRITFYCHSYITLCMPLGLQSAYQMVHLGGIEPAVCALKGHRPNR